MRSSKDIDFTKVDFITYDVDEYLNDIPMYELVSNYISLFKRNETSYFGQYGGHTIIVNVKTNECFMDSEKINAEQFATIFEGEEVDPCLIIKRITGIDLDDYISDVTYSDGTTEYLEVKGKNSFVGGWRKMKNDR